MDNGDLELGVKNLLGGAKNEPNHTNRFSSRISIVPGVLRDLSPRSFSPRVLSIGPLHKDDVNVQAFEGQKRSYLFSLMNRINSPQEEILKSCMKKASDSMNKIRECYVLTKDYSDGQIAEMMVMDACFILEFIYQMSENDNESYSGNKLLAQTLIYDMVLLENQIPFFFLEEIFQDTILKFDPDNSLVKLIHPVVSFVNLFEANIKIPEISSITADHILGHLHECYKPQYSIQSNLSSRIHSAIELDRAGVNFKPYSNPKWLMGMEVKTRSCTCFSWCCRKPTLRMPVLTINHFTELVFRNLIAYEQSCQTRNYITSYAMAMDMLVNTQEDIDKLVDSRVLVNNMGSNEEAVKMINGLCKEVSWVHFFYDEEWNILDNYCNKKWPKRIASLRSTYFNSPWSFIAFVAGIILFILTVVQTVFTIMSAI